MKILLFGASGLLGRAIKDKALSLGYGCISPMHAECDVTQAEQVKNIVEKIKPDIVINAAGFTRVDDAQSQPEKAFAINQFAVRNIAMALKQNPIPLVHFSTDYVFDGNKEEGYTESDPPSPISVYGKSKAAGEKEIQDNLTNFYIIRTAWLFGPGGKNFVDTMLSLAEKGQENITVVSDQIGTPTFTLDLADSVLGLINSKNYGMYHIVNGGKTSWYDYAVEIFHSLGIPQKITPITSKELNRPAKRPLKSLLLSTKLPQLRHWKEALHSYLMDKEIII